MKTQASPEVPHVALGRSDVNKKRLEAQLYERGVWKPP